MAGPTFEFLTGEDFEKYLSTREPSAVGWRVTVCGDDGSEIDAEVFKDGWISRYRRVEPGERVWIVDSHLLPDGANPEEIRIYLSGDTEPVRVEHPHKNHPLWDHRGSRPDPIEGG